LGFPGCEVQSVLCFLKGRTSSFLQSSLFVLILPCLGKITSPLSCKSLFYILTICVLLCWYEVSIEFFLLFLQCYGVFLFFEYCVSSGGIFFFFFRFIYRRCFVCIYPFITLVSGSVYFWRAGSLGVSLAGRVIFSFCVGFRCVECRSGTIYLSASLGWVAGLYGFFSSGALLWWVWYD
jgi:hypothetical protein